MNRVLTTRRKGRLGITGKALALVLCCASLVAVLAGCSSGSGDSTAQQTSTGEQSSAGATVVPAAQGSDQEVDKVTWGVTGSMRSVDPAHAFDGFSWSLIQATLEPLVVINPEGKVEPVLATKWTQSDPTTVDFTLRKGVTFWDGSPLSSEDVVFSIQRLLDPETAAEQAAYFSNIKSVTALTSSSVRITLKGPQPEFVSYLALAPIIEKKQALAAGEHLGDPAGLVMGTGAYEVVKFSPSTGATLKRYPGYWGDEPSVAEFELRSITNPQALLLAVQSGELDGTFNVPLEESEAWEGLSDINLHQTQSLNAEFLMLDVTKAPFDDVHARRAMTHLVDQAGIANAVYGGHGTPIKSVSLEQLWVGLDSPANVSAFYAKLPEISVDIAKAKEELSQSKTPDGFKLTVYVPSDAVPSLQQEMQAIANTASEVGIDITLKRVPIAQYLARTRATDHDPMGITGYAALAVSPMVLPLALISSPNQPSALSDYANPTVSKAFEEYRNGDPAQQLAASKVVVETLAQEVPFVPLMSADVSIALAKELVYADAFSGWNTFGGTNWAAQIEAAE